MEAVEAIEVVVAVFVDVEAVDVDVVVVNSVVLMLLSQLQLWKLLKLLFLPVNYQKADEQRLLVVWSSKEDTKQRPIRRGSPCSAGL